MNATDWAVIMDALRILSPLLGGWAVYLLRQVVSELRALNQRLIHVEDWQQNHDRLDNLRFESLQQQVDRMHGGGHLRGLV
mgnify:FL=1